MTKYIDLGVSFLMLVLLDIYFKSNIAGIGQGSIDQVLLVSVCLLGFVLLFFRGFSSNKIFVRRSVGVLVLFFSYFALRIVIDIGSVEALKAYTVATTGGVVLFYFLGFLLQEALNKSAIHGTHKNKYTKTIMVVLSCYLFISYITMFDVYHVLLGGLRSDIFLIADLNGAYQRAGAFLIITFLLNTAAYMRLILLSKQCDFRIYRFFKYGFFLIFCGHTALVLITSQMIGSNAATVTILALNVVFLSTVLMMERQKMKVYLGRNSLSVKKIVFGRVAGQLASILTFGLALLSILIASIITALDFDILSIRLFGFGLGESSSINSRLELLGNFVINFNVSPFLGNMNIQKTMGNMYVHSFLLSSMTHLGILGTMLLLTFLVMAFKEVFISVEGATLPSTLFVDNVWRIYSLMTVTVLLLIAIMATFFTWSVVWFGMGLFFGAIRFEKESIGNR